MDLISRNADGHGNDGEPIYVANAGLVLAAPFLPSLFTRLGLMTEDTGTGARPRLRDAEAVSRGVHALQYLVDGGTSTPEHLLALNKVLCGVPPSTPVAASIHLSDEERATCDSLLAAMIANWSALSSTSVAGLRETFLQREGQLLAADEACRLTVRRRTPDVLVDQLPWSISVIFHPWMPTPVHVTWWPAPAAQIRSSDAAPTEEVRGETIAPPPPVPSHAFDAGAPEPAKRGNGSKDPDRATGSTRDLSVHWLADCVRLSLLTPLLAQPASVPPRRTSSDLPPLLRGHAMNRSASRLLEGLPRARVAAFSREVPADAHRARTPGDGGDPAREPGRPLCFGGRPAPRLPVFRE